MTFLIKVKCRISEDRDIGGFVSYCPAFDVYSQGASIDEALEAIKEAVRMTLEYAFQKNRFEEMLHKALSEREQFISMEVQQNEPRRAEHDVEVPLSLVAQAQANASYSPSSV